MKRLILKYSNTFKNLREKLREVAEDHPGKRIELWFEDEAGFGQQGPLATV